MDIFLYNPKTKKNTGDEIVKGVISDFYKDNILEHKKVSYLDIKLDEFIKTLNKEDRIIITGGDGTLHFFANEIKNFNLENDCLFIPSGTGNDFSRDVSSDTVINDYITNLPTCTFNNQSYSFINGCGLGLDGFVCYLVNNAKKKNKKTFLKSTLKAFTKYKKSDLTVYVDGEKHEFKGVYLASIMNGRYEGGGMMMAPNAVRLDDKIEICVIYHMSKLRLMLAFKSIYKGRHTKYKKSVEILQGKTIRLESEKGLYMQIDGEDFNGIKELEAKK